MLVNRWMFKEKPFNLACEVIVWLYDVEKVFDDTGASIKAFV